ncbi:MAG: glycosyltransferase [Synergistaceae bacterium]|jgi:cellulose synthase/poly-beta-1,6-N-acetylglucosamine synthase-like glycosyltransferase|nr:glycosyltransferase [Synergistaceae bacterium]
MSRSEELYYLAIWWGWLALQASLYTVFALLFADAVYQFVIGIRGLFGQRAPSPAKEYRRFAILIPAHDEAAVLEPLLSSLRDQTYPADRFRVFVSCDNCEDDTAGVAISGGAEALLRTDTTRRGKTWNVRWALTRIPMDEFDALAMFDADNLVEADFLSSMNDYMEAHPDADAIQGVLDVKNPDDNWLTRSYAVAYWFTNRFWQMARGLWGLSCTLGGTGLVICASTLRRLGWNLESLTEDLEMSTRLILSGSRVHWNNHAVIYDEKPQKLSMSTKQRTRWMQGHYWVFMRYGASALKMFIQTRQIQYLDLLLYLLAPAKCCIAVIAMLGGMAFTLVNNALLFPTLIQKIPQTPLEWAIFLGTPVATMALFCAFCSIVGPSLRFGKLTLRYMRNTAAYFWFGLTWIPILFKAPFMAGKQGDWAKTEHTRNISLEQMARRE